MLQARRAMSFLDARSESAGESYSRVVLDRVGIRRPTLQYEVWHRGVLVGRADFGWEEFRTLGEFDGKEKYGRLLKPGQTSADVVFAEKRREDALRDLGWQVVSAGYGKTSTILKSCVAGSGGPSRGAFEPPEWSDAPASLSTPHL
jgi:hypothetical protein